ncbi:hypothetical protein QVD17_01795 [Tagetes erecta]|uniref:Uncharacterized protein n=1 Tax=Tagetes erecta TaxID=13708 RepID=A0AAD8P1T7_TARER|nr:hypothetical protein QVD17_01795 [Tagetes erecta]
MKENLMANLINGYEIVTQGAISYPLFTLIGGVYTEMALRSYFDAIPADHQAPFLQSLRDEVLARYHTPLHGAMELLQEPTQQLAPLTQQIAQCRQVLAERNDVLQATKATLAASRQQEHDFLVNQLLPSCNKLLNALNCRNLNA